MRHTERKERNSKQPCANEVHSMDEERELGLAIQKIESCRVLWSFKSWSDIIQKGTITFIYVDFPSLQIWKYSSIIIPLIQSTTKMVFMEATKKIFLSEFLGWEFILIYIWLNVLIFVNAIIMFFSVCSPAFFRYQLIQIAPRDL